MRALIIGAGMTNKGAELMLRTLVSEMSRRFPHIDLGLSPAIPNYKRARELGLARLAVPLFNPGYRYRFPIPFALRRFFPRWGKGKTWRWSDVDLVLDISGFAYTDQWGTAAARNLARIARDISGRGGHVFLFPQSFGPFSRPGHSAAMRGALTHVDLVFARDRKSLEHLAALSPPAEVLLAPDITLLQGFQAPATGNWAAVVPNIRLLDQGRARWGATYVSVMATAIDRIAAVGITPVVIVHDEGGGDASVAARIIRTAATHNVDIRRDPDPVSLKRHLATAQFVVGSRFHALASSLSCNVPVLALGWSHKYRELLSTYGLENFNFDQPSPEVFSRLDGLLDPATRERIRAELRRSNQIVQDEVEGMWRVVARRVGQLEQSGRHKNHAGGHVR